MLKKMFFLFIMLGTLLLPSYQKEQNKPMNTLKINFQEGDLPSLHPHALMIYLRGISVAKTLFECLTRIDEKGEAQLAGAKSVEISTDRLRYTFTLRNNKWSNGTPVTAFQYENAWKEALSPSSNCSRAELLYMILNAAEAKKGAVSLDSVGVKALSDNVLTVTLAYPSPYFLELLAQPICAPLIDPKKKEPSEFNGPFYVAEWKHGDSLQLEPNTHYWDSKHVFLKKIDIFMLQDVTTPLYLYEKGELDWVGVPLSPLSSEQINHLKKGVALRSHPVDRAFWIFLNTQLPSLSSSSIRKALSLSIDRSAITKHLLIGGQPLAKPIPSALQPLATSSILKEDLQEAKRYLELGLKELGFTKDTLPPLVITYSQQANRKQVAEYLQEAWSRALGIKVQLKAEEWNVLRCNLEKGLFEISGCFEAAFYKDPMELLERLATINSGNFPKWVYLPFSEKIYLAKKEKDPKARMQLLKQAEEILMEQMPFIPVSGDTLLFAHHPQLKGYAFDYVGAVDFSRARFSD